MRCYRDKTIKMDYEVSSHCNYRCTMCLMSEIGNNRPANMSFSDFKKSIDMQQGLIEVKLQGMGEPLLNPDFFEMVDYAVMNHLWVRTVTNASLLHLNDSYKKMIDSQIGEIQISVDGAKKETFESIRKGSCFEQVVDNCRMLNDYAQIKGEQWRTSCWMLVQKENVNEVEELLELAAKMKFTRLTYSIAIGDWGKDKYIYDKKKDKICAWLFARAYISADMRIVPCCAVCGSNTCDMGDALDFINEWNNNKYQEFRKLHLNGNIPKMCRNCYEQ